MSFSNQFIPAQVTGATQNLNPQQQALFSLLAGQTAGGIGTGITPYQGPRVAGPTGLQQQTFDRVSQLLGGGVGQDTINQAIAGPGAVPGATTSPYDPQATRTYWEDALLEPSLQTFERDIVPRIQENFIGQNAASSGASNRAIAGAYGDMFTNLQGQLAETMFGTREAALGREFQGAESAAGREFGAGQAYLNRLLSSVPLQLDVAGAPIDAGLTAGTMEQAMQQAQLDADRQTFQEGQPYNNPYYQNALNLLGIGVQSPIVQSPQVVKGSGSAVIPALASIASSWLLGDKFNFGS